MYTVNCNINQKIGSWTAVMEMNKEISGCWGHGLLYPPPLPPPGNIA